MGGMSDFLSGGQSGGYDDIARGAGQAQDTMRDMYSKSMGMLNPWMQAGQSAIPQYNDYLHNMQSQMNGNWMNSYQQSPYAKYLMNNNLTAMNNAAAATGRLGSGANIQENGQMANQIASADMQNWFNNMQSQNQMYGGGLDNLMRYGYGSAEKGVDAGSHYADALAELINGQAMAQANSNVASESGKDSAAGGLLGGFANGFMKPVTHLIPGSGG